MTIKGLWNYYKTKVGYENVALCTFKGQRIAVDAFAIMYETRSKAKTRYLSKINPFAEKVDETKVDSLWKSIFLKAIIKLMISGVIPVFVFDGLENDPLKIETLKKRSSDKEGYKSKIASLCRTYQDMEPDLVPVQEVASIREYLSRIDIVPYNSVMLGKDMCKELGIPYVYCKGEGERTCALLNNQDVCGAVITPDGDSLCCGARTVFKKKCRVSFGPSEELGYETARLESILSKLDMTFAQFQDLCIMSGTDFNENIKNVSWVRSYNLLKKHGSVEAIGNVHNTDCINYKEVKTRFSIVPWESTTVEHSLNFTPASDEMFARYGVIDLADKFRRIQEGCVLSD